MNNNSGYMNALPFAIINLGCEMIYIIEQRLKAQNIGPDRSKRVLNDVIKTLFSIQFVEELLKPQEIFSMLSTKKIFEKIAHSSIMRLNTTSMSKLFDLMSMGVKQQILCCKFPEEIIQVTNNHLSVLQEIVKGNATVSSIIHEVIARVESKYATYPHYEFIIIRQTLLKFFQEKHIKVSLFIQEGLQSINGILILNHEKTGPPGSKEPGEIEYIGKSGDVERRTEIGFKTREGFTVTTEMDRITAVTTTLGSNLYTLSRKNKKPGGTTTATTTQGKGKEGKMKGEEEWKDKSKGNQKPQPEVIGPQEKEGKERAAKLRKEMDSLADLIQGSPEMGEEAFTVNLFPDAQGEEEEGGLMLQGENVINIQGTREPLDPGMKLIYNEFQEAAQGIGNKQGETEEDDILDLLDSV